jgi:MoaA/NifB/PqqE/SkfB family radical SAM enzyme/protein-L-isoaspartate O-methyltransferase
LQEERVNGTDFFIRVSKQPPFNKLHPQVAAFFKEHLAHEKAIQFGSRTVVNTHFPPFPSRAFDNLAEGFSRLGGVEDRRLYSVTLAVTNRCTYNCWHCYNAGRTQTDLPLSLLERLVAELKDLHAVMITLTGGEPLLRDDLEAVARLFDETCCLTLGTTGDGLTDERAGRLKDAGVFGVGISLDSAEEVEHDRLRGRPGAFRTALDGLQIAGRSGLYPYIIAVATRDFLERERFLQFMRFAGAAGALEVHLLEPSATGRLVGRTDLVLSAAERRLILDLQREVAQCDELPILSSYAYLESPDAFGCGAGLTHLYVDGSGEVCPCQLVPLSFGNIAREPLSDILARMGEHFRRPRAACVGRALAKDLAHAGPYWPTPPALSAQLCQRRLPSTHAVPRFFRVHSAARGEVGVDELRAAYNRVHGDYDDFWLSQAAAPVDDLIRKLPWRGDERVFEAGCGTGYATALLARHASQVLAVDISEGMLTQARARLQGRGVDRVRFVAGDALALLTGGEPFDVVFSTWVLGYIPLQPFFAAASGVLRPGGRVAFIVHKENSPREPLEIFGELIARDPAVLQKRVAFDFPRDAAQIRQQTAAVGLHVDELWEGSVVFRYESPARVLEHLLKSGAGTAFYDALDPVRRPELTDEFLRLLAARQPADRVAYEVCHEYIACIARK